MFFIDLAGANLKKVFTAENTGTADFKSGVGKLGG